MNRGLNQRTVRPAQFEALSFEELNQIKADVARGYRRFCRARGIPEDTGGFAGLITADCRLWEAKQAGKEQAGE